MSEIYIEDLNFTKEFEELSKLLEKVFRRSLSYTKVKNISLNDVGKNFSIYPEIKITFESHNGWEGGNPKQGKKLEHYDEKCGTFISIIPFCDKTLLSSSRTNGISSKCSKRCEE